MTKHEFVTRSTRIINEMFDNPNKHGIYPTAKCFEALGLLFDEITELEKQIEKEIEQKNSFISPLKKYIDQRNNFKEG